MTLSDGSRRQEVYRFQTLLIRSAGSNASQSATFVESRLFGSSATHHFESRSCDNPYPNPAPKTAKNAASFMVISLAMHATIKRMAHRTVPRVAENRSSVRIFMPSCSHKRSASREVRFSCKNAAEWPKTPFRRIRSGCTSRRFLQLWPLTPVDAIDGNRVNTCLLIMDKRLRNPIEDEPAEYRTLAPVGTYPPLQRPSRRFARYAARRIARP